jgi:hypothetical protein
MLYDFERLYIWKKARRFRSPLDVLVVLPKELDIRTMLEYYANNAGSFESFVNYVEWLGGRLGVREEDLPCFSLEEVHPVAEVNGSLPGALAWAERGIDVSKIGIKMFVPIEETIRENERRQKEGRTDFL